MASPRLLVIPETMISRAQLRELGLRVYGERTRIANNTLAGTTSSDAKPLFGYNVSYNAGREKIADNAYSISVNTIANTDENGVTVNWSYAAVIKFRDGTISRADVDPSTINLFTVNAVCNGVRQPIIEALRVIWSETVGKFVKCDVRTEIARGYTRDESAQGLDIFTINLGYTSNSNSRDNHGVILAHRYSDTDLAFGLRPNWAWNWDYGMCDFEGEDLITPEGQVIGKFNSNNLFLYPDLFHKASGFDSVNIQVLRKIFETVAENFGQYLDPEEEVARDRFVKLVKNRKVAFSRDLYDSVAELNKEMNDLCVKLVRARRELKSANTQIAAIEAGQKEEGDDETFIKEYDLLMKNPKIASVAVRGNSIIVNTNVLNAVDDRSGKEHEIGAMTVTMDTLSGGIMFANNTRRVKAFRGKMMHAPHVFQDGRPCLGNTAEAFPTLITSFQLVQAAELAIEFIESVNTRDSAGSYVNRWPLSAAQKEKSKAEADAARMQAATAGATVTTEVEEAVAV